MELEDIPWVIMFLIVGFFMDLIEKTYFKKKVTMNKINWKLYLITVSILIIVGVCGFITGYLFGIS